MLYGCYFALECSAAVCARPPRVWPVGIIWFRFELVMVWPPETIWFRLWPLLRKPDQPCRCGRCRRGGISRPECVTSATRMDARRSDDIAAIAAHIEARPDAAARARDWTGVGKPGVPAVGGDRLHGRRQLAVLDLEHAQRCLTVLVVIYIDVKYPDAAGRAGADADVVVGARRPPPSDGGRVRGGVMGFAARGRLFPVGNERKHCSPLPCVIQSGLEERTHG